MTLAPGKFWVIVLVGPQHTFQNFNKISEFFASYFCIYDMYFK